VISCVHEIYVQPRSNVGASLLAKGPFPALHLHQAERTMHTTIIIVFGLVRSR
jgi:hypothetical protein